MVSPWGQVDSEQPLVALCPGHGCGQEKEGGWGGRVGGVGEWVGGEGGKAPGVGKCEGVMTRAKAKKQATQAVEARQAEGRRSASLGAYNSEKQSRRVLGAAQGLQQYPCQHPSRKVGGSPKIGSCHSTSDLAVQ